MSRLVVFGASGKTGRRIVDASHGAGHEVTSVVRRGADRTALGSNGRVIECDVFDRADVARAVAGHDAIISALGHRRASQNVFARDLSPADLHQATTTHLIEAARVHRIDRLFVLSLHGAGDSRARTSWLYRWLVTRTTIRMALADSEAMESSLAASGLDWLAVRPVTLLDGKARGRCRVRDGRIGSLATIARADVASFVIAQLSERQRSCRTPSLSA
jgi:putative NADH-flavin reductase